MRAFVHERQFTRSQSECWSRCKYWVASPQCAAALLPTAHDSRRRFFISFAGAAALWGFIRAVSSARFSQLGHFSRFSYSISEPDNIFASEFCVSSPLFLFLNVLSTYIGTPIAQLAPAQQITQERLKSFYLLPIPVHLHTVVVQWPSTRRK